MGLLSPWFLLGALAVGVPIWLHLIRHEQAIRIPFSSLMFFRRIPRKSVSRQRLKYLLLLAARILVILLIVLAFAHPYFPGAARLFSGGCCFAGHLAEHATWGPLATGAGCRPG